MNTDPVFTPQRIEALNAVDLRLFGVTHGIIKEPPIEGITDDDYSSLKNVVDQLNPQRGDVLAIEPSGFVALTEPPTFESILPVKLPENSGAQLSEELKNDIIALLEQGRSTFYINNLAYVAAHALLCGLQVRTAETTMEAWLKLQADLASSTYDEAEKKERTLIHRNGKMLARLGDIAIEMISQLQPSQTERPVLLDVTGRLHTSRLGKRLSESGVSFTANL